MFKYFRALWYAVTGRFSKAARALHENEYVMEAVYDQAIKKNENRFETVKNAVAELISIEKDLVSKIKGFGEQVTSLTKIKNGAQIAMQKRIDTLKASNKTKEEILGDVEFIKHKAAFDDASSTLTEKVAQMNDKETDLAGRRRSLATYKAELQKMQRASEALKGEKQEALADVAIAKQSEQINAVLAGITSDSSDKDLADARAARKRAVARSEVVAELAGNDAKAAESEYLQYANAAKSTAELDGLLNWGDEAEKKDLEPAKLPE